jgi:pSer/pThr/pTyr-binding forkhead associated (FHA) protein
MAANDDSQGVTKIIPAVADQLRRSPRPFEAATRMIRSPSTPTFATLTITGGPGAGSAYGLFAGTNSIGRTNNPSINDVGIDHGDGAISISQHCVIDCDIRKKAARLIDVGSTNPIYVNGELVVGIAELAVGDRIGVGETELTFAWK